ncbi:MAG: Fe-S cluster assembly protein SufD [Bacteroidales bacterium]|jgi:Fe-S cluster assembly protein SufD|nr:Fe-S cluster assembly protein SufD [Bacteroidales bacterium]
MRDSISFFKELGTTCSPLPGENMPAIGALRKQGFDRFCQTGIPPQQWKTWIDQKLIQETDEPFIFQKEAKPYRPIDEYFQCKIGDINAQVFAFLNGWYINHNAPLTTFSDGIIIGSIFEALTQYPDLVLPYFTSAREKQENGMIALNQALFNDGLFIYIPDNQHVKMPIQLVSLIESNHNIMVNNRHLIIVGKNSKVSVIQCDDSICFKKSIINNVTEIRLAENATLHYYKMENKDQQSILVNQVHVEQKANSNFLSASITFNAGYVKNQIDVELKEPFASTSLNGLYLVDKKQYIDNHVLVDHQAPDCTSNQLYKGIVDDEAQAYFNGHVIVAPHAQKTAAYQSNRNITLTDEAKVISKPFLEIYADDVKCSHGSTVGQLDESALFYMRSRGLCERSAKVLLMYAFANEVANCVEIPALHKSLTSMIQRRLSGELSVCNQCENPCNSPVQPITFDIDLSKI